MSEFSKTLGSLRREKGLSQRKAAQELGVSQALLSHYENGAREPKLEFVTRVCTYYGVTADYILGRGGPGGVLIKCCPDGADRFVETVREVFDELCDIGDNELIELALKYLAIPAENVRDLLKNPDATYDPMRDAELKTVESQLVNNVRRMRDAEPDDHNNQECSDD